jgi:hypothetical protein
MNYDSLCKKGVRVSSPTPQGAVKTSVLNRLIPHPRSPELFDNVLGSIACPIAKGNDQGL